MLDYNRVQSRLLVGAFPESSHEVAMLRRQEGVTAVLNVQTDEDIRMGRFSAEPLENLYAGSGVRLCRVPVRDFDGSHLRERLPECVRALRRLLEEEHTVYLHCTVGVNRSPTVATAYLHWCLGWKLDSAVKHLKACRSCSPNVDAIRQAKWEPSPSPPEADKPSAMEAP